MKSFIIILARLCDDSRVFCLTSTFWNGLKLTKSLFILSSYSPSIVRAYASLGLCFALIVYIGVLTSVQVVFCIYFSPISRLKATNGGNIFYTSSRPEFYDTFAESRSLSFRTYADWFLSKFFLSFGLISKVCAEFLVFYSLNFIEFSFLSLLSRISYALLLSLEVLVSGLRSLLSGLYCLSHGDCRSLPYGEVNFCIELFSSNGNPNTA